MHPSGFPSSLARTSRCSIAVVWLTPQIVLADGIHPVFGSRAGLTTLADLDDSAIVVDSGPTVGVFGGISTGWNRRERFGGELTLETQWSRHTDVANDAIDLARITIEALVGGQPIPALPFGFSVVIGMKLGGAVATGPGGTAGNLVAGWPFGLRLWPTAWPLAIGGRVTLEVTGSGRNDSKTHYLTYLIEVCFAP